MTVIRVAKNASGGYKVTVFVLGGLGLITVNDT